MSRPPYDPGPIRLSPHAPRRRRPGQACPDETVADARRLVEGSALPLRDIARRLGISGGTLSQWALNGGWVRPAGAPPWSSRYRLRPGRRQSTRLFEARRGLREAEGFLVLLEAAPAPAPADAGRALDHLAAALDRLDEAARAFARKPHLRPPATTRSPGAGGGVSVRSGKTARQRGS